MKIENFEIKVISDKSKSSILGGDGCCGTNTEHTDSVTYVGVPIEGGTTTNGDWDDEGCC